MNGTDELVTALRRAAHSLVTDSNIHDRDALLADVVATAVRTVGGADGGGLSRIEKDKVRSSHATDAVVGELDQLQSQLGQGPCLTAADEPPADGIVLVRDLADGDARRWPEFAPRAVELGYRSMLSTQLYSKNSKRRAALNLYSRRPDAFDENDQRLASLFASQAAVLIRGADEATTLSAALDSRDVIGQAKGILRERHTLSDDEAFQMLVEASQATNIKLVDVARWLCGELDERRANAGSSTHADETPEGQRQTAPTDWS
jgi:hypothetical protein